MKNSQVQLKLFAGERIRESSLVVDGLDISCLTSGLTLELDLNESPAPTLTVQLIPLGLEMEGEMPVGVSDEITAALVALGWTPPEGKAE